MKVADGYLRLRVPESADSVWAELANLIGEKNHARSAFATASRGRSTGRMEEIVRTWAQREDSPGNWEGCARTLRLLPCAQVLIDWRVIEDRISRSGEAFMSARSSRPRARPHCGSPWIPLSKKHLELHQDAPGYRPAHDEGSGAFGLTEAE